MIKDFGLPWIVHLLLQFFVGFFWGALIRITRGRLLWGVLYFITGGVFGIGWLYDFVMLILKKNYKFVL